MQSEELLEEESPQSAAPYKEERGRSTIVFPYLDLDDAVQVARAVQAAGGTHCQLDQLAAQLDLKADSSGFNLKLNTARIFGLITRSPGIVTLTTLGTRICDPRQEAAARVESFLFVPLYNRIYEQFKGVNLPPMSGLENAIGNMGVAAKQKGNARQVFQRAATQAGFFAYGPTRLVLPTIKGSAVAAAAEPSRRPADHEKPDEASRNNGGGDDSGGGRQEPLIIGLIKALPKAGEPWTIEARRKWLQLAATVFDVIYKDAGDGVSLRIEIEKDSAAK